MKSFSTGSEKLVFIFGPTGIGKTELACEVAEGIGEIISVDSMQVYRGLDRGTAKPSEAQLKRVPHHLVSVVPPDYRFSAGDFRRLASKAVSEILSRGKLPILVGGTGLYFKVLEYDFIDAPGADTALRESLYQKEEKQKGSLYSELVSVDPEAARSIHPNDLVRIVRAIEIFRTSGIKFSDFCSGGRGLKPRFETMKIGLAVYRAELYSKIEARCWEMIKGGLDQEVKELLNRGCMEQYPSMKGLGYSHYTQFFKGCYSARETERLFIRDTKRYAKRQLTWFRKESAAVWHSPVDVEEIRKSVESFLER